MKRYIAMITLGLCACVNSVDDSGGGGDSDSDATSISTSSSGVASVTVTDGQGSGQKGTTGTSTTSSTTDADAETDPTSDMGTTGWEPTDLMLCEHCYDSTAPETADQFQKCMLTLEEVPCSEPYRDWLICEYDSEGEACEVCEAEWKTYLECQEGG